MSFSIILSIFRSLLSNKNIGYTTLRMFLGILYSLNSFQTYQIIFHNMLETFVKTYQTFPMLTSLTI
jgi:hypothetical protein